jgi:ribosomal protein S18 acetylase RimI-like enzyme
MNYTIRHGTVADVDQILTLYRHVAASSDGLTRAEEEMTFEYVDGFVQKSLAKGIILVAEEAGIIIGEVHCYTPALDIFAHVFGDLTLAIDPQFQHRGIGRALFTTLMHEIEALHPEISRVELVARESNVKAISLYESLGFKIEGRFKKRIPTANGGLESELSIAWLRNTPAE